MSGEPAITVWLSGVVVDWMFTSGGVDVHALLFVDHHCVNVFIRVSNFVVDLNRKIILTAKFSRSMVVFAPLNK